MQCSDKVVHVRQDGPCAAIEVQDMGECKSRCQRPDGPQPPTRGKCYKECVSGVGGVSLKPTPKHRGGLRACAILIISFSILISILLLMEVH